MSGQASVVMHPLGCMPLFALPIPLPPGNSTMPVRWEWYWLVVMEQHWLVLILHSVVGHWTINVPTDESVSALNIVPVSSTSAIASLPNPSVPLFPICEAYE